MLSSVRMNAGSGSIRLRGAANAGSAWVRAAPGVACVEVLWSAQDACYSSANALNANQTFNTINALTLY
jgi:hypothetical protein